MRRCSATRLLENTSGAVAPTVALSLFGLIAAGGIAFDYARMASMDTELQSAADHAALAAATQLDGRTGACDRARAAAVGMVSNQTLMANDGNGVAVTVTQGSGCAANSTDGVRLYQDINHTTAATDDSNAKFVMVVVDSRTANYALTPVVGALSSGAISATAFAGLNQAICKVPPVMFCNPKESTDPDFTVANYIGDGMRLISNDGGGSYGPGNFGFLATNAGNGASVLGKELGSSTVPGDCVQETGVTTDPGNMISVRDALNTRFGIYTSVNSACGSNGSSCPPSANIRQDLLLRGNGAAFSQLGFVGSSAGNQKGWLEGTNPYPGSSNITTAGTSHIPLTDTEISKIDPMGYPEDACHSFKSDGTGTCANGLIGDGNWDRYAYFKSNAGTSASYSAAETANPTTLNANLQSWFGTTTPTRYKVYQWEMANAATRLKSLNSSVSSSLTASPNPAKLAGEPTAITPSSTNGDRRVLSVAVINCTAEGLKGKTTDVAVQKWIDVFLVEPSEPRTVGVRTSNSDVYVEIIGETDNATNSGAVQLIKKSVPYLIE
jgi:Flp pilus assembly protein TadG